MLCLMAACVCEGAYNYNFIQQMQKVRIMRMNTSPDTAQMVESRIEPDHYHKPNQNKYIIHKIPKADKRLIHRYQQRTAIHNPHVPHCLIDPSHTFYHTVYLQQPRGFSIRDMIMLPLNKRIQLLKEILEGVKELAQIYGFFYVTEKMLGYNAGGRITVWIHEDLKENVRRYPIDHGKFSQDIFVSDFKAGFGGNLKEMKEFKNAKTVASLIQLLANHCNTAQSIYMSQPQNRTSHIHRRMSHISASELEYRESRIISDREIDAFSSKNRFNYCAVSGFNGQNTVKSLKKSISFSYLPNQMEKSILESGHKVQERALSSSVSMQNLQFKSQIQNERNERNERLKTSNNSVFFSKVLQNSASLQSLTGSTTLKPRPKIQFNYMNPNQSGNWKKKKDHFFSKIDIGSSQNLTKSQSLSIFPIFSQNDLKQPLKISFPHTTAHSFVPFASNGNISLNFKQSANLQSKVQHIKQDLHSSQSVSEHHISEQSNQLDQKSNEIQMDLDVLFSDSQGQLHSHEQNEQMSMIMEEFQNVLLS